MAGCSGEEALIPDTGESFFPLEKGIYHIYTVHEVRYAASAGQEILNYEIRTEVVDSFPSTGGGYTFVIHRSRRPSAPDPWEALDTWSVKKDERNVIVAEGNTSFLKLKFPVRAGTRWNGNTYNALGDDAYEFKDIGELMEFNGMSFDKTMAVEQERNDDFIVFNDLRREIYARNVGLIYKEIVQLNYCTDDNCIGQQNISQGVELRMVIKEYGKH